MSSVMPAGAPRSGWKRSCHGPLTAARSTSTVAGTVRDGAVAGLRNTTNTVPHGSRWSGTVVRPATTRNDAGSREPVSACHSSGCRPLTRKVASTSSARALRLSTK